MSTLSRRRLIASGVLVVAFSLSRRTAAQGLPGSLEKSPLLESWIRIDADGRITLFTGKAELGQGIKTALIQIAAIQSATLNGKPLKIPVIRYDDILEGASLKLVMAPAPSKWASDWEPAPLPR